MYNNKNLYFWRQLKINVGGLSVQNVITTAGNIRPIALINALIKLQWFGLFEATHREDTLRSEMFWGGLKRSGW